MKVIVGRVPDCGCLVAASLVPHDFGEWIRRLANIAADGLELDEMEWEDVKPIFQSCPHTGTKVSIGYARVRP